MTEKPEALILADALEDDLVDYSGQSLPRISQDIADNGAAELRRLSIENDLLGSAADKLRLAWRDEVHRLIAQRDALLAALKAGPSIEYMLPTGPCACSKCQFVRMRRAAIKMAEGENHAKSL